MINQLIDSVKYTFSQSVNQSINQKVSQPVSQTVSLIRQSTSQIITRTSYRATVPLRYEYRATDQGPGVSGDGKIKIYSSERTKI